MYKLIYRLRGQTRKEYQIPNEAEARLKAESLRLNENYSYIRLLDANDKLIVSHEIL